MMTLLTKICHWVDSVA